MDPKTRPKMSAPKSKRDDPEQSKLFIEKAREIGADEEKSAADELNDKVRAKRHSRIF